MEIPDDRKLQQRIVRRKEKIQRMIEYLENRLIALDSVVFLRQEDQQRAISRVFNRLNKLRLELKVLESGRLPGSFGYYQPEE